MAAVFDRDDRETTERLELRALERMISVLCEYIDQMSRAQRPRGKAVSRETDLQLAVFAERRAAALRALEQDALEPAETRIARLEKHVKALDCSRDYFRTARSV